MGVRFQGSGKPKARGPHGGSGLIPDPTLRRDWFPAPMRPAEPIGPAPVTSAIRGCPYRSDLVITEVQQSDSFINVTWNSVAGNPYGLQYSTNLVNRIVVPDSQVGLVATTSVQHDLAPIFPGGPPDRIYHRVLDRRPESVRAEIDTAHAAHGRPGA